MLVIYFLYFHNYLVFLSKYRLCISQMCLNRTSVIHLSKYQLFISLMCLNDTFFAYLSKYALYIYFRTQNVSERKLSK